jgi:AMP nucleosidase
MSTRISPLPPLPYISPSAFEPRVFDDATSAVDALTELYERNTNFLMNGFGGLAKGEQVPGRFRACYPQVSIETTSFGHADSRLSYGHVTSPGLYTTTITRPKLFRHYLKEQLELLMRNHSVPVTVSESTTPIPLHFAFGEGAHVEANATAGLADLSLRDLFDTPDLNNTDDLISKTCRVCRRRLRRSPPSGSTIRSPASATTRQQVPSISRTSCCLRITSSTLTSLPNGPAK